MQELQKVNICDLTQVILVLTQKKAPAHHVIDMDTKKLNFNFYQIRTSLVNFVRGKDTKMKF
jgi:hypothetical protein